MKKSKVLVLSFIILVAALMVGKVAAYFVTSERTHNVITTNGLKIELIEDTDRSGNDGRPMPFEDAKDVMPGSVISKIPRIRNIDGTPTWVRVAVKTNAIDNNGEKKQLAGENIAIDFNAKYWLDGGDGFWYYYRKLEPGKETETLFTKVTFGEEMRELPNVEKYDVELQAQAVQAKNNGDAVMDAIGWPEE